MSNLSRLWGRLGAAWFPAPVASAEALARFVGERAAFVAQVSLYGYLRTRMGTQFPKYFEDPVFSREIRAGAVRLFVSCAADLSVHAAALTGNDGRLDAGQCAALARYCYSAALAQGLADVEPSGRPDGDPDGFAARAAGTIWGEAAIGEAAFQGSVGDVVRFAPVIDEFKRLDRGIVRNSIRFKWRDVREQLRGRLDAEAVCADWRTRRP